MALAFGILLNGLRLRQRLSGLRRLDASGPERAADAGDGTDHFLVISPPGVDVDDATRRDAIACATAEGLDVLDLVPDDLSPADALDLARWVDTTTFREAPFAPGRGAGHALVVSREAWARASGNGDVDGKAGVEAGKPDDQAAMVSLAEHLKRYASRSTDLRVAPRLHAASRSTGERLRQLQSVYGSFSPLAVAIPAARSAFLLAGVLLSPGWGAVALACHALQPYLVTAGSPLEAPSGRSPMADALARLVDPLTLVPAALAAAGPAPDADDPIETRREGYTTALAGGLERFFEPRRDRCPWCGSSAIQERLRTSDLSQHKPGEFVIDECMSCGLLFQNPCLSLDGLDFYYRDFYDGLGSGGAQLLFAYNEPAYQGRVALACRHFKEPPRSWLDVGSGYGHFCMVARGLLPETRFDGLDIGTGIEEAEARCWVDRAYRGLFPDLADGLAGGYDVVSMHHYLEHTRDPRAELVAAHTALAPGGHLLVEVPDPESRYARLLGRYWLPWFQPQHQYLLSVHHLVTELTAQGFSVVEVERGAAHQPVDLGGAVWTWAGTVAPKPRAPWLDEPTAGQRVGRAAVLAAAAPVALAGVAADRALRPLINTRAQRWSNAYRLLARRL